LQAVDSNRKRQSFPRFRRSMMSLERSGICLIEDKTALRLSNAVT
jgi:hypothetical protein